MEKCPQVFRSKCAKFQSNRIIFEMFSLPQSFQPRFGAKTRPQAPKMKILKKWKTQPKVFTQWASVQNFSQIGPFLKSPGCQPCFGEKLVPRPQKSKFSKNEKNTPRYSPKEQVCQISAKSNHFWSVQLAPKFWGDTQTFSDSSSTEVENRCIGLPSINFKEIWSLFFRNIDWYDINLPPYRGLGSSIALAIT